MTPREDALREAAKVCPGDERCICQAIARAILEAKAEAYSEAAAILRKQPMSVVLSLADDEIEKKAAQYRAAMETK